MLNSPAMHDLGSILNEKKVGWHNLLQALFYGSTWQKAVVL